jgi:hypothetical protein
VYKDIHDTIGGEQQNQESSDQPKQDTSENTNRYAAFFQTITSFFVYTSLDGQIPKKFHKILKPQDVPAEILFMHSEYQCTVPKKSLKFRYTLQHTKAPLCSKRQPFLRSESVSEQ